MAHHENGYGGIKCGYCGSYMDGKLYHSDGFINFYVIDSEKVTELFEKISDIPKTLSIDIVLRRFPSTRGKMRWYGSISFNAIGRTKEECTERHITVLQQLEEALS